MTQKQAREIIRSLGCTLVCGDEYRVNLSSAHGGTEATAYYTTDLQDAVDTARAMAGSPAAG